MARYNVVILGGGPGGYVAAIRAAQLGLQVALVEKEKVGGLCLNWGCIPSKALLRSAEIIDIVAHAAEFGVTVAGVRTDLGQAVNRSREVVEKMVAGVEFLLRRNGVEVIAGEGRLRSPHQVVVQGRTIESDNVIIATGAHAKSIPGVEVDGEAVITSREALELREPPSSIVIVGGGAVGVEFAYLYRAFGSQVAVVEMLPHLLPNEDEDVSIHLERAFARQGIKVHTGARVQGLEQANGHLQLRVAGKKGEETIPCDKVLLGVGMAANSEGLGLEELGVATEGSFIRIDERMATSVPGVYAVGDVTGPPLLAHVASAQGVTAVETIAGLNPPRLSYQDMPRATYCRPQVASIGLTEAQAKERGHQARAARFPFRAIGKALAIGETEGFAKIVIDAESDEILGCHLIGPEVTELISEISLARVLETSAAELGFAVHPHPTLSEAVKEAALAARGEAIHFWFERAKEQGGGKQGKEA